jgi:hypothetical protein
MRFSLAATSHADGGDLCLLVYNFRASGVVRNVPRIAAAAATALFFAFAL